MCLNKIKKLIKYHEKINGIALIVSATLGQLPDDEKALEAADEICGNLFCNTARIDP